MTAAASVKSISKRFGATRALETVDFDVMPGEIHALVGENGAGKSTLVRILGGVHRPDQGEVEVGGVIRHFHGPRDAIAAGIVTIPQELRLVPALSVAENIALGDVPVRKLLGAIPLVDRARMREDARDVLAQLDFAPDPDQRVDRLHFAERQLVAIAKAVKRKCRVFILDEPTAALESREIARLFAVLERMKSHGTAIVYVSHRLEEVVSLADRCTVLRDGRIAAVARRGAFGVVDLVHAMTGRDADEIDIGAAAAGPVLLDETGRSDDSIRLHAGEVIGLAGLLGSGTDRVLQRLFGVDRQVADMFVIGEQRRVGNPASAIAAGIGMVPGERRLGLVLNQTVRDNILLPSLAALRRRGTLDRRAGDRLVAELMDLLDIRPRRPELKASQLSGGNQQKVIIAKWLARRVGILLLDEPTQGIDIAAKAQIHALVRDFAARGGGVIASSSELAELARICDAVLAMRQGRVVERITRADGLDERRLRTAIGG